MAKAVRKIVSRADITPKKKRVAAYARVSSGKDAMLNSLSTQISYYSGYIQKQADWEYMGVYADEAFTGTKESRPEFQRLISDCKAGKIDMVITKSISRFARNTVTLLKTVRDLKELNVNVYFENENLNSISGEGEMILTLLASVAQEESRGVSENCKWRIRKRFKDGYAYSFSIFGYELKDGTLHIVENEADIVRMIFTDYLNGMGYLAIIKKLNSLGIKTKNGYPFRENAIYRILRNEKYIGDMLLQKVYSSDHLEKRKTVNKGELPMYHVADSHEAIISRDVFQRVQEEIKRRASMYENRKKPEKSIITGKIECGYCGKNYRRKTNNAGTKYEKAVWICSTYNRLGKNFCASKQIPESVLEGIFVDLGSEIEKIIAYNENRLECVMKNGDIFERSWKY